MKRKQRRAFGERSMKTEGVRVEAEGKYREVLEIRRRLAAEA